jgi:hypothetical protein
MALVGQLSAASFVQGASVFEDFVIALSPSISKTSGQIAAQEPHPMHFFLSKDTFILLDNINRI